MSISNEVNKINQLIADAEKLKNQASSKIQNFTLFLGKIGRHSNISAHLTDCINTLNKVQRSAEDFVRNYKNMKEANTINSDKYFHAKANCEAAQNGIAGAVVSRGISDLRELTDVYNNTLRKGMTLQESYEDSIKDQEANRFGRTQGTNNPDKNCGDLVNKYRPNSLDKKY